MELKISKATENDLSDILKIYEDSGLDKISVSLEEAMRIFIKMSKYPDYHIFVARFEGKIVGTFALLIMENLAHHGSPSAIVEDVGVLPSFQGQGIGKEMMLFAMDYAKEKGCYKLNLSSNMKREKAHQFYESMGFRKHGFSFMIEP